MTTVVAMVVAVGMVGVFAALVIRWIVKNDAAASSSLPPLFIPIQAPDAQDAPRANGMPQFNGARYANGAAQANGVSHANREPHADPADLSRYAPPASRTVSRPQAASVAPPPHVETQVRRAVADDRASTQAGPLNPPREERRRDAETIRFFRPTEQPLQFLPGHLEVLEGMAKDREFRFVRVPGDAPHVFLGRNGGPSPNMVGLGSETVSRQHARMEYADGQWHVKNLSRTNPLVVNDEELLEADAARPLLDGDRLELGEVVLRFHAH